MPFRSRNQARRQKLKLLSSDALMYRSATKAILASLDNRLSFGAREPTHQRRVNYCFYCKWITRSRATWNQSLQPDGQPGTVIGHSDAQDGLAQRLQCCAIGAVAA